MSLTRVALSTFSQRFTIIGLMILAAGCATRSYEAPNVELIKPETVVSEARLLDVGLIVFDPGLPDNPENIPAEIDADIREAESRYFAYHLKTTLQETEQWAAIRVIPNDSVIADVQVSGRVQHSDGNKVRISVWARDARGREWFSKRYTTRTDRKDFSKRRDRMADPYQNVFNEVANDLHAELNKLSDEDIAEIRTVARMRFYADMAPSIYGDYVEADRKGRYEVVRLPADSDPMATRLEKIRGHDALFQDTLNEHYANFYFGIALPYEGWRKASREAELVYKRLRRSALLRGLAGVAMVAAATRVDGCDSNNIRSRRAEGALRNYAIVSGVNTFLSSFNRLSEARMQRQSIKELSDSFGDEAAPMVVEVEGQSQRLTGTASAQYDQWRELLRQMNEVETGFPATPTIDINGRTGAGTENGG